jgi:hypothetical protein
VLRGGREQQWLALQQCPQVLRALSWTSRTRRANEVAPPKGQRELPEKTNTFALLGRARLRGY